MSLACLLAGAALTTVSAGGSLGTAGAADGPADARASRQGSIQLRWLAELGAESLPSTPRDVPVVPRPVVVSVPGAVYVFAVGPGGSLEKRKRLASDPSAPYGLAVNEAGLAVLSKEGSLQLWSASAGGELNLRWSRDLGERATSVGWDGGESLFVATWRNRLIALSAADGRPLWTADVGGRAEAPAVADGRGVFVATKAKTLLRLDAATGRVQWKVELPGVVLHAPALLGDTPRLVICGTWDGQLITHEAVTGRPRWSASLPAKLAGAPLVSQDGVIGITTDGAVHAYDPAGKLRWTQPDSAQGGAAALLQPLSGGGTRLLVVSRMLVALDAATGNRIADYPKGAAEELRQRFASAMLDGVKTYTEGEKRTLLERDAFDVAGSLFGPARLQGPLLAFGTEEEWAYVFDALTLRPLARYHAGQACSGAPSLAAGRVLAAAGQELFGLDPAAGRVIWRRNLGSEPGPLSGDAVLGIIAGGRAYALETAGGVPRWIVRGRFRSVASAAGGSAGAAGALPWLADDGEGTLRPIWSASGTVGDVALPLPGDLLPIVPASEGSWLVASREGQVLTVAWEPPPSDDPSKSGQLVKTWETRFDERLAEVRFAGGRLAVRTESGSLVVFNEGHQEIWRLHLAAEEHFELLPRAGAVAVFGAAELHLQDWSSGERTFEWKTPAPALAADVEGGSLRWLDRAGGAHRVDIQEKRLLESRDLGVPLAAAAPAQGGFLMTTAAGEVGFVAFTDGEPGAARGGAQAFVMRGEGQ